MRKFFTSLTTVATLTLAAIPALGLLQAAHAAEAPAPVARVSLAGLDLTKPAQAAEFTARLDRAADALCSARTHDTPPAEFTITACKVSIRQQAAAQLSQPQRQGLRVALRATPTAMAWQ